MKRAKLIALTYALLATSAMTAQSYRQSLPIVLSVDATNASARELKAELELPVHAGPLTLYFPKWTPGEHAPSGRVEGIADLHFTAAGRELHWRRDLKDGYSFHLLIPAGVSTLQAGFSYIFGMAGMSMYNDASAKLLMLRWNHVVLYPAGVRTDRLRIIPKVRLPAGWRFGSALQTLRNINQSVTFQEVTLDKLLDSPLLTGEYYKSYRISSANKRRMDLDIAGDSQDSVDVAPDVLAKYTKLQAEAHALFGAEHYDHYTFLVAASDFTKGGGVEHHESSDERVRENFFLDKAAIAEHYYFLPHEYVHSWNGKYRRPFDLTTTDYQVPEQTGLLWVYEGLTMYYGDVLGERVGLLDENDFREALALRAAKAEAKKARSWRSTQDTADSAPEGMMQHFTPDLLWPARQRDIDYYFDGELIWLDVDATLREETNGRKSLDDFVRAFYGGSDTGPKVVAYTEEDIYACLNTVVPYAWRRFFRGKLDAIGASAPIGGMEKLGWRLTFDSDPNAYDVLQEKTGAPHDLLFSLGFTVDDSGVLTDVVPGSPGGMAGLVPGMKIGSINNQKWSIASLVDATSNSQQSASVMTIKAELFGFTKIYVLDYHAGARYPHLSRIDGRPDLLTDILRSRIVSDGSQ